MQRRQRGLIWVGCWAMVLGSVGCGSDNSNAKGVPIGVIREFNVDVGNYLIVDEDRLRVAPPRGWDVPSRTSRVLIQFVKDSSTKLPRIVITGEDSPWSDLTDTTSENVRLLAKRITDELPRRSFIESPMPLIIGQLPCVRYVIATRFKSDRGTQEYSAHRQIIETVQGGRRYVIDLRVPQHKIVDNRDAAYAVIGAMQFMPVNEKTEASEAEESTDRTTEDDP